MLQDHSAHRRLRALRGWLDLLGAILVAAATVFGQEQNGVIYGHVRDAQGQPQHLMVHLEAEGGLPAGEMFTDSEGQYAFRALPNGEYWVVVEAEGFQPARRAVRLDDRISPKAQADLVLEKSLLEPAPASPSIPGSRSSLIVDAKKPTPYLNPGALREFQKGNDRRKKGDLKGAIAHYVKALGIDPQFYPALNNLGIAYERLGDRIQAEQVLLRALAINPDDGESYVNLGHVLYEEGRYAEARARLEEGVKRSTSSASGRFFLGSTDFKLGDLGPAESNLKQACALDPNGMSAAHLQLANLYLRLHNLAAAERELEDYLRAKPDDPQAPAMRKLLASLKGQRN